MDEITYTAASLPKNIRQIGEIDDTYKIYIEDYVITYLNQISKCHQVGSKAAVLLGRAEQTADYKKVYFVYGACCSQKDRLEEGKPIFDEGDCAYLLTRRLERFEGLGIIGWALIQSEFNQITDAGAWAGMTGAFEPDKKLFFRLERENLVEDMYVFSQGLAQKAKGFNVFYDKNPKMEAYLISLYENGSLKQRGGLSSQPLAESYSYFDNDRNDEKAVRQFRSQLRHQREHSQQHKTLLWFRAASMVLLIMLLLIGISTINQYERMRDMEVALLELTNLLKYDKSESTDIAQKVILENVGAAAVLMDNSVTQDDPVSLTEANDTFTETVSAAETDTASVIDSVADVTETVDVAEADVSDAEATYAIPDEGEIPGTMELVKNTGAAAVSGSGVYRVHTVAAGDTLNKISYTYYKSTDQVKEICGLNNIADPDSILTGQRLLLP